MGYAIIKSTLKSLARVRVSMLPCSGCGRDLTKVKTEETWTFVDVTKEEVFGGQVGQREVPGVVCPECDVTTAL